MPNLVLDIGNFRITGAFFDNNQLASRFALPVKDQNLHENLKAILKRYKFGDSLIASSNEVAEKKVEALFMEEQWPFMLLDRKKIGLSLEVDEPLGVDLERLANCYGALFHFPGSDSIVVTIKTAITFDFIKRNGVYIGGAVYPLPKTEVELQKPAEPIGKTALLEIQSGLYWGVLGAIERIVDEMRLTTPSPSSIKVIATGEKLIEGENSALISDLKELVDLIDSDLTLKGIHEILKEQKQGV